MYARKRLDIGWLDLASGLLGCATAHDRDGAAREVESWFESTGPAPRGALCCLSVRSGLDLYLRALALPPRSEVLMSALTIPGMWDIVAHHGLVPVPLDVDPRTLAPRIEAARAASPRTRAILIAHLFGTRIPLRPWTALARERGWLLLEDCAQAFTGREYRGDPAADVSMFSFGPIKTAAALAGGVLAVADGAVLAKMRALQAEQPLQPRKAFAQRVLKYAALKALTQPLLYRGFVRACAAAGQDHDRVIQGTVRGFAGGDFFEKIRRRPGAPLCALIARRLRNADGRRVAARMRTAEDLRGRVNGQVEIAGADAGYHSYWVFAILCDDPERAVAAARAAGFDATRAASLDVVPVPEGRRDLEAREAQQLLSRIVYLPVYPELPGRRLADLAHVLRRLRQTDARPVRRWVPQKSTS